MSSFSGIRESDPPHKLGKLVHYRCANAASENNSIAFQASFQVESFRCHLKDFGQKSMSYLDSAASSISSSSSMKKSSPVSFSSSSTVIR